MRSGLAYQIERLKKSHPEMTTTVLRDIGDLLVLSIAAHLEIDATIFRYFISDYPLGKSITCTFYSSGKFPVDLYEGICSFYVDSAGDITALNCDLIPFWEDERIVHLDQRRLVPTDYIMITIHHDFTTDLLSYKWRWTDQSDGGWDYLTKPRRENYGRVEVMVDSPSAEG